MNANAIRTNNNGVKFLAVIMALAMVVVGAAVVMGDNVQAAAGETYDMDSNEKPVTVYNSMEEYQSGTVTGTPMTLAAAIASQSSDGANGKVWVLEAGLYNVTGNGNKDSYADYTGSKFYITADNLTIIGAGVGQTIIYADYANGATTSPESVGVDQQNTITITGAGVTVQDMTVEVMISYTSGLGCYINKAIETYGNNTTISNIDVVANTHGDKLENANVPEKDAGASIMINSDTSGSTMNITISNVDVQTGGIQAQANVSTLTGSITDTTMSIQNQNDISTDILGITGKNVEVNLDAANLSNATDIINAAKSGTEINVNQAQSTTTDTTIEQGVTVNFYQSYAGKITNNGQANILNEDADVNITGGTGSTDTSGVTSEANLGGFLRTDTTFTDRQVVTVNENLTLVNGTTLVINGTLIVPEGMTITIEDGAKLVMNGQAAILQNNGTIVVESTGNNDGSMLPTVSEKGGLIFANGATAENNGIIDAAYYPATASNTFKDIISVDTNSTLENNGTVTIGTESAINIKGTFVNAAGATFTMNGELSLGTTAIKNSGSIVISGSTASAVEISLAAEGASIQIVYLTTNGTFVVNDKAFKDEAGAANTIDNDNDLNGAAIIADGTNTISGLTLTSITYDDVVNTQDVTYKGIDISGTVAVGTTSTATNPTITATLTLFGKYLKVTDTFDVGANLKLNLGYNAADRGEIALDVSGTMNITAPQQGTSGSTMTIGGTGEVTVTGEIVSLYNLDGISGLTVNAASYYVTANAVRTYHYTTLEAAVESGATVITTTGSITVGSDITIPSGVTVTQNGAITISEDATLTVADGGRINQSSGSSPIQVDGTLYIEVSRTGFRNGQAVSDVYSTDGTDARYTNLSRAMEAANAGDTIYLYNDNGVRVDYNLVIKEGVTVDTNQKNLEIYGTTLTINGTLFINNSDFVVTDYQGKTGYQYDGNIVLNGYMKSTDSMTYSINADEYPAGAYYSMREDNSTRYYISTVENAVGVINDTIGDKIQINGEVSFGDVAVNGVTGYPATVEVARNADVSAGTVTLGLATVSVANGAKMTGTFTDGTGTFVLATGSGDSKPYNFLADSTIVAGTDNDGNATFTLAGNYAGKITVQGVAIVNNLTAEKMVVEGTANFTGNSNVTTLTVSGTASVRPNGAVDVGTAYVLGTFEAVEATSTTSPGTANVNKLYVGLQMEKGNLVNAAAGTVNGNVSIVAANGVNNGTAYVSADSTLTENITGVRNMQSTEFYVNDALWLTAYATAGTINVHNAPVTDARFEGWMTANDDTVIYGKNTTPAYSDIPIDKHDALYASVDYNVYSVQIYTDGGIGSVAIDGVVLTSIGNNVFITEPNFIAAGQHNITYTLKSGYEGTPTLASSMVTVSGMTFTLSGDYEDSDNEPIHYQLSLTGTSPSDSTIVIDGGNGGSDMSLTDYLLIVLVILIVIMAIIVALRLMRS